MALKGIEYVVVEEPLRQWTCWMQEWAATYIQRPRVPVLEIESEEGRRVLAESNEINLMLDAHDGKAKYTPEKGSREYEDMEAWWNWCDENFKPMIDLYKYGENRVFDAEKHVEHTKQLRALVQELEADLRIHSHLVGNRLTLADIAIIPFVRQIMRTRDGEFDFTDFPCVRRWAGEILSADWFESEVMKKHPLAKAGA